MFLRIVVAALHCGVLYAGVDSLDQQVLFGKVCMIILCDDVQTTTAWEILNQFTQISVEHLEL